MTNSAGFGLLVDGGAVDIAGAGAFNVTGANYAVYAYNGGQATLTSAAAVEEGGTGACAAGAGSSVRLTGGPAAAWRRSAR